MVQTAKTVARSPVAVAHPADPFGPHTDRARIYLNNAATTWPKPEPVIAAVEACLRGAGSAMRQDGGGEADLIERCRNDVAALLGAPDSSRIALLSGCTYALNLAILGLPWREGDTIVISGLEHHAVSRPARKVAAQHGVRLEVSPYQQGRPFDLEWFESVLLRGRVRLVATTAASNATGEILPTAEITRLARAHGALSLVDAAQAAGIMPVDIAALGCDMLAFAGHKGLLGPLGVGGLCLSDGVRLEALAEGGTTSDGASHEMSGDCPSAYEVGSHNLPAIAGLGAGVRWIAQTGVETIRDREHTLAKRLRRGMGEIPGVTLWGGEPAEGRTAVVLFSVDGASPKTVGKLLAERHGVTCRSGFHCAPMAHEALGTVDLGGAVRLSPGYFTREDEIDAAVRAVRDVAVETRGA